MLYKRTKDLDKIFYNYSKHPNLEKISNVIFTTGENDLINQIVLNDAAKTINILPDLKNIETLINANIISHYKLGQDLGQLELMEDWANNYLDVAKNYHSNAIINPNADAGTLLQKIKEFYDNETLNKKEILEAVIKATVDCFPKYSDGYCSAAYTKDGYIDVFYYRNWDRN